jgi:hypothetical protein
LQTLQAPKQNNLFQTGAEKIPTVQKQKSF